MSSPHDQRVSGFVWDVSARAGNFWRRAASVIHCQGVRPDNVPRRRDDGFRAEG